MLFQKLKLKETNKTLGYLASIRSEIMGGASLSDALGQHPRDFAEIYRALVASGKVAANAATAVSESAVGGPAACLAGSCSQATLQQIANAEKTMAVLHLDPEQIVAGPDEARRALKWAAEQKAGQARQPPQ